MQKLKKLQISHIIDKSLMITLWHFIITEVVASLAISGNFCQIFIMITAEISAKY